MANKFANQIEAEGSVNPSSGGGNFRFPYGNLGFWQKSDAYEVSGRKAVEVAKTICGIRGDTEFVGQNPTEDGSWDRLYFRVNRYAEAQEVARAVRGDEKAYPNLVTQFFCDRNTILPDAGNIEFDPFFTIRKRAYGARGHEPYTLILIPSMVHAYAVSCGLEVPEFGFAELVDVKNFVPLQDQALGDYWLKLQAQREALWSALGEPNFRADTYQGALNVKGEEIKGGNVTVSEKLSEALRFAQQNWKGIYGRIGQVANPSDAKGRVPVVVAVFDDKVQAMNSLLKNDEVASDFAGLYMPASFSDSMTREEFAGSLVDEIKPVWEAYQSAPTGPKKVSAKQALLKALVQYELSEDQFSGWREKLNF